MGSSSSKPRPAPYPLLTPGFNVPYGQNPNHYLPPQLQTQNTQNSTSTKKKRKSKRGSVVSQEKIAQAYVQGWHAGQTGMGPVLPHQPTVVPRQVENVRPVIPPPPAPAPAPAPVRATPLIFAGDAPELTTFATPQAAPAIPAQSTQPPFAGGAFAMPQQQQEPPVVPQQQSVQPQAPVQERVNPDIARVLQPLPPPNPGVFGPPPPQQPLPPLSNPLPTPPRDLYELSPYNTLLNLPQTTALLTAAYSQQGGLPPPSYGRRGGNRTGGLLRALTGRGRKEEDVRFVPVFINGQPPPVANPSSLPQQLAAGGPSCAAASPCCPSISDGRRSTAPSIRTPIRFSSATPEYFAFLNYSPHHIIYAETDYPSAMHLHEALKYLPNNPSFAERIRNCPDVGQVHVLSEQLENQDPNAVRSDWPAVYLPSMEEVILHKFRQHPDFAREAAEYGGCAADICGPAG
ncbi:S5A-REDUCTASE domain-containing protein [Mycena venus]|uniref:S5A-REDUCTASE domain-containing protein n=1 Tax=Mycena venus TaxID=2733690 RepID=A0A8H7D2N2_9AGAR|nr:S5A-REDUCTASE domain-containing protein [Mycena venus]